MSEIDAKKIQAGALLGMGESTVSVSKYTGVSRQSLSMWKNDQIFNKSYNETKTLYGKFKNFVAGEPLGSTG